MGNDLTVKLDLAQERANAMLEATEKTAVHLERIATALKMITEEQKDLRETMNSCKEGRNCCLKLSSDNNTKIIDRFVSIEKELLWIKNVFGLISVVIIIGAMLLKVIEK